jgi:hypothetical protein
MKYETRTEWHRVFAWSNLSKFPDGSSNMISDPPGPCTMLLRKVSSFKS